MIRDCLGSAFTLLYDWSTKLVPLSQPIKTKPHHELVARVFPPLSSLIGFSLSSHWLSKVVFFLVIFCYDYFAFGFTTLNQKALY